MEATGINCMAILYSTTNVIFMSDKILTGHWKLTSEVLPDEARLKVAANPATATQRQAVDRGKL